MATRTVVRMSVCPRCGRTSQIVHIDSQPFPEESMYRIVEECTSCDYVFEREFSSSNAQTNFDHSVAEDAAKSRVGPVLAALAKLIIEYSKTGSKPDRNSVSEILAPLGLEDFPRLYLGLQDLGQTDVAKVRFSPQAEIESKDIKVLSSVVELTRSVEENKKTTP